MTQLTNFLHTFNWFTLSEADNLDQNQVNSALAYQDTLVRYVVKQNEQPTDEPTAVLHFFSTEEPSIYLGAKDTRIPRFALGIDYLRDNGMRIAVRPHGGLAVISDPGICNVSLVADSDYFPLSIDEGYQLMVDLMAELLEPYSLKIESYEIEDSYCPGSYDLVVNGYKIGGIAQRRFKTGVAIAAYLSISGDQMERGRLVQTFYRIGEADDSYPSVNPDSMRNINDFIDEELTVKQFEQLIRDYIRKHSNLKELTFQDEKLNLIYQDMYEKQIQRSKKFEL